MIPRTVTGYLPENEFSFPVRPPFRRNPGRIESLIFADKYSEQEEKRIKIHFLSSLKIMGRKYAGTKGKNNGFVDLSRKIQ